jgi:chromosome segregation ATPase
MKTQKHYLLGFDVTKRKSLYAEIDALTEENREQAAEIVKLQEKIDEQAYTIMAQRNRIDEAYKANASLADKLDTIKAEAADFKEKYNAAVKYQQNTQAAYDELKAEFDKIKKDRFVIMPPVEDPNIQFRTTENKAGCVTARVIGFKQSPKQAQPRGKNGRFEKSKRDDNPRK